VSSMAKGDKIITIGGIHGSVHHISEKTVTIKLSEGVFVPFEKSSIQTVEKVGKGSKKVEKIKVEPVDDKA
ncbi:preprotein translocase subunit YajC, partial [bacterium]|nr:preprotein translocase subunit YajC [bacterium]